MTPRQARLALDIFTAAVIVSVALALAALTWRVQGDTGTSPATAPVAPGASGQSQIGSILALAPFGRVIGGDVAIGSEEVSLRAIFAAQPASASVALIADASGQVSPFSIGEATPGGIVEAIETERVLLRSGSGLRVLSFEPAASSAPEAASSSSASGAAPDRQIAPSPVATQLPPPPPPPPAAAEEAPSAQPASGARAPG